MSTMKRHIYQQLNPCMNVHNIYNVFTMCLSVNTQTHLNHINMHLTILNGHLQFIVCNFDDRAITSSLPIIIIQIAYPVLIVHLSLTVLYSKLRLL